MNPQDTTQAPQTPRAAAAPETPQPPVKHPMTTPEQAAATGVWPGAFGIFKASRKAIGINLWVLIGVYVLSLVVSTVISSITGTGNVHHHAAPGRELLSGLLNLVVGSVFGIAITDLLLSGTAGQELTFSQSFRKLKALFVPYAIMTIVTVFLIGFSFILLIIPFFFVMPRLVLAPYFLVDRGLGSIDAIKASWNQTKGHSMKVWGIIGATFVMFLPALTVIGIPVAIYLLVAYSASMAILYRYISKQQPAAPVSTAPAEQPASVAL